MGIVNQELADFETPSGQHYQIELNESGIVHIHTDHVRIDLTRDEFMKLAQRVTEGYSKLEEMKDGI